METNVLRVLRYLDKNGDMSLEYAEFDLEMDQLKIRTAINNINKHKNNPQPIIWVMDSYIYTDIETEDLDVAMQ